MLGVMLREESRLNFIFSLSLCDVLSFFPLRVSLRV
jgi:hypothetical protein